jgi:hypothetical protein
MTNSTDQKFEVGNVYQMRFIGDSELTPAYICVKLTAKTATFERFKAKVNLDRFTAKIRNYDSCDYVRAASYSMAPSIYAKNLIG